ncbi:MAG: GNAT family protein [Pseudomonadota bacterium]
MSDGEKTLGAALPDWTPPEPPSSQSMQGRFVRVERLTRAHAAPLHAAFAPAPDVWRYMPYGPFPSADSYAQWVDSVCDADDPLFFALVPVSTGLPAGVASYLRIAPDAGSIEVGHIALSPSLQRTPAATEAMVLMMTRAFNAGYRRFEWKCNALNLASRRAAERLGLSYEGVFRQATVVKGRNRDTAWFAAIDREWLALKTAFDTWLDLKNFDAAGHQRQRLSDLTRPILAARDPALS